MYRQVILLISMMIISLDGQSQEFELRLDYPAQIQLLGPAIDEGGALNLFNSDKSSFLNLTNLNMENGILQPTIYRNSESNLDFGTWDGAYQSQMLLTSSGNLFLRILESDKTQNLVVDRYGKITTKRLITGYNGIYRRTFYDFSSVQNPEHHNYFGQGTYHENQFVYAGPENL